MVNSDLTQLTQAEAEAEAEAEAKSKTMRHCTF